MQSNKLRVVVTILIIMGLIQIVNMLSGYRLLVFGLIPRDIKQWYGIFAAPWLHGDIYHFLGNMMTLTILAWLCLLHSVRYFIVASTFIIMSSGILLWVFGRSAIHIGASAWIFGLWSLLMANACYKRTLKDVSIGLAVLFFYGGLFFGMLPQEGISFEGHIAGALSGILFVWFESYRNKVSI